MELELAGPALPPVPKYPFLDETKHRLKSSFMLKREKQKDLNLFTVQKECQCLQDAGEEHETCADKDADVDVVK